MARARFPHERAIRLNSGRACRLVRVGVPLLPHYFALSFSDGEPTEPEAAEMFGLATRLGREASFAEFRRLDAYTVIYSGHATRRARGWHLHLVLLPHRWAKAWLYFVLGGKNLLQALRLRRTGR